MCFLGEKRNNYFGSAVALRIYTWSQILDFKHGLLYKFGNFLIFSNCSVNVCVFYARCSSWHPKTLKASSVTWL